MPNYVDLICEYCGKPFKKDVAHYNFNIKNCSGLFYCSKECLNKSKRSRTKIKCANCGKIFEVSMNRINTAKFCSKECCAKYKNKKQKNICEYCGKEFYIKQSGIKHKRGHFCSRKCYYKHFKLANKVIKYPDRIEVHIKSKKYGEHTVLIDKENEKLIKNYTFGIYKHHIEGVYYARIYIKETKK